MKILLIDDAYPINTRNGKILQSLAACVESIEMHIVAWDREERFEGGEQGWKYYLYTQPASYGNKWQKLKGLFGFRSHCQRVLKQVCPDLVILSHWNTLPMLSIRDYRRNKVIYDNLDAPTGPWFGRKVLNLLEYFYMRKVVLTIHASRFYSDIYPKRFKQIVLENKPTITTSQAAYKPENPLRVVFLGNIRYIDILKNLADAVSGHNQLQLILHGGGPDYQNMVEYTKDIPNVVCTGPYRYSQIEEIYHNADVIWGAYPNRDFNVLYAISNKFHESIAYAVPAIYAEKTKLADFATSKHLGCEVDPYSVKAIESLLLHLAEDPQKLCDIHQSLLKQQEEESSWDQDFKQLMAYLPSSSH